MSSQAVQLPSRFPVGTRYVIEGRAGRIMLRYLEFPDGRQVNCRSTGPGGTARVRPRPAGPDRKENFEKKLTAAGTIFEVVC